MVQGKEFTNLFIFMICVIIYNDDCRDDPVVLTQNNTSTHL